MKACFFTACVAAAIGTAGAMAQSAEEALGDWHGVLSVPGGGDLRVVITIAEADDGALSAEFESPDQAPGHKVPVTAVSLVGSELSWSIDMVGASYVGTWDEAAQVWAGTFSQGADVPLTLARGLPE